MAEDINIATFTPTLGIIVYQKYSEYYLETHEILTGKGGYVWGAGQPFQREQLQELAVALKKENLSSIQLRGILPESVVYYQPSYKGSKFVWWLKAEARYIQFSDELKMKAAKCKLPSLLFAVNNKSISVFAMKGHAKPTAKTELFNAPFFNIYNDGKVCMGNTTETLAKEFLDEELERWERRFFGSKFTEAHGEDSRLAAGHTMKDLYKTLTAGKAFPMECLKPAKYKTVGSLLKHLNKVKVGHDE